MAFHTENRSYELLAEIGEGAYGKVFKAREISAEQRLVAIKKLNFSGDPAGGVPPFMIREVALLRKLGHFNQPNIIKLLDVSAKLIAGGGMELGMVFEFVDQDLTSFISKAPCSGLGMDKIKDVMSQLLLGLDFLHCNLVVHRDLKPDNILISSRGEVKIADFGLARPYAFNMALTPVVVTLWYRPPEVLLGTTYMSSVDIWSAGCILAELFLLKPLFKGSTEIQQLQKIFEVIGIPSVEDWPKDSPIPYSSAWGSERPQDTLLLPSLGPEENDLLAQCLAFKPTNRISAFQSLAHPFLM
ncbi:cyclin-dependent kinase 6 [Gadus morhua]|nr:cyclin-dependent kinase 6-like [Gadus morhua]